MRKVKNKQQPIFFEKVKKQIPEILIVLGIFCIAFSGFYWLGRLRALRMESQLLAEYNNLPQPLVSRPSRPRHVFIKWFVDSEIEAQVFIDNNWTISGDKTSYLDQSARPKESGNIILYGHNTRKILGNIRALKGGEEVALTTEDGSTHLYEVSEIHEVEPNQTKFLEPTSEETLTLYTCSGFLDQKRFIVRAIPKK